MSAISRRSIAHKYVFVNGSDDLFLGFFVDDLVGGLTGAFDRLEVKLEERGKGVPSPPDHLSPPSIASCL